MHSLQELAGQFTKLIPQDTPPPAPPASPAAADATAPAPPSPVQIVDHAGKGFHLNVCVRPDQVVAAAELLDRNGFALDAVTGMDWIAENEMEVVYDYFHPADSCRVVVRTRVPRSKPEVPTILQVYPGANWHERERMSSLASFFSATPT